MYKYLDSLPSFTAYTALRSTEEVMHILNDQLPSHVYSISCSDRDHKVA